MQSCIRPARTFKFMKKFVKFAIKKNKNPVVPETIIHLEFLSIMSSLLLADIQFIVYCSNYNDFTIKPYKYQAKEGY